MPDTPTPRTPSKTTTEVRAFAKWRAAANRVQSLREKLKAAIAEEGAARGILKEVTGFEPPPASGEALPA